MSKWLGQRFVKGKKETRQLPQSEPNDDLRAGNKTGQQVPPDSIRSLIERALTDAEQIVASIKMRAQKEAEEEAIRIIEEAKQHADEINKTAEAAVQKPAAKEAKPAAKEETRRKAEKTKKTKEAQKQAEKEAKLATKEEPKKEEPVQVEKVATVSKPAEAITEKPPERPLPKEKPEKREPASAPLKLDSEALYQGEVELAIAVPVDPAAVSKLYNNLQATPEIKIRYTRGSWDRGTIITLTLDNPLPLIDIISKIPDIEVTPAVPQENNAVRGVSGSLLGGKGKKTTRIDLTLKTR